MTPNPSNTRSQFRRHAAATAIALVLVIVSPHPAGAVVPRTMSYQGVLTTPTGTPVADGNYDLTFRIYEAANGTAAAIWSETRTAIPLVQGGFSVILGAVTPIDLPFDKKYWLSLQVGSESELTPRVELAASPYALALRLPFSGAAGSSDALVSLNNLGSGPTLGITGRLEVGSDSTNGRINVNRSGSTAPILSLFDRQNNGGAIEGYGTTGALEWRMFVDQSNNGSELEMSRLGGTGFQVDTRFGADDHTFVKIDGLSRSMTFSTDANTDDDSVQLPGNSISSLETLDEPGLASNFAVVGVSLTSSVQSLLSRTIDCPSDGYVLALVTASAFIPHVHNNSDVISIGVSSSATSIPASASNMVWLDTGVGTGTQSLPISAQGTFFVTPGLHTFYIVGQQPIGTGGVAQELRLALLFVPTSYGSMALASASPAANVQPGPSATQGPGLSAQQIGEEQREAEVHARTRLAREVQQLKQQLRALETKAAAGRP